MVVCVRSTASCSLSDRSATATDVFAGAALFFYAGFLQQAEAFTKQPLNQKQLPQLLRLLDEKKGQWQLALHKQWQLRRSYDQLLLEPVAVSQKPVTPLTEVSQRLVLGEGIYLSEKEWIGYFPINEQHIPKKSQIGQSFPKIYR